MTPPLGAHVSIAGGVSRAIERGMELSCEALQVFVKNASRWQGAPLSEDEATRFRDAHRASSIGPIVAHSSYLINLAATDSDNLAKSRSALVDELQRCDRLGIPALVVHPGAHLGAGLEAGIDKIAESLRWVYDTHPELESRVLLENTAGQGTLVGHRLAELAAIISATETADRVGICIDTCHAWSAGYALDQVGTWEDFLTEIDERFGPREPGCVHVNDSRIPLGGRRDRHANIGQGEIPPEVFARLLEEPRFRSVPMILETPLGDDGEGHRRDLETLRSLRG